MRKDHRPYWFKKLLSRINQWYSVRFLEPNFDSIGVGARYLKPNSVRVNGCNINAGRYLHLISDPLKPVKITTWGDKQNQGHITIGDFCLIAPGVELTSMCNITIADNCMLAADVIIHDCDWHGIYNRLRPFRCTAPVNLHQNVWVGARAIITKGVTIGENSVIGAGAVVTKDIPANCVAAGNPAKVVKTLNPNKKMLTREFLFRNGDDYWQQQNDIDAFFTLDNTTAHWLRSIISPSTKD